MSGQSMPKPKRDNEAELQAKPHLEAVPSQSRSIRIAVVSDAAPHRNGVGAYYQDLSQHLAHDDNIDMRTFCPLIGPGRWSGGLNLPLPGDATQKFVVPNPYSIWRKLKDFEPDLVIVPTPALYGLFGAVLGRWVGAKVIIGFHTWYEKLTELYWDHWQEWLTRNYFGVSNKILFRYADNVVVNSDFMAETAAKIGAPGIELVGTPISYDYIQQPLSPYSGGLKKVFFAGRLAAEKNLDAILKAAQALPGIEFSIAGDGPEKDKIEAAAGYQKNLRYLGWLDRDELLRNIDEHDMLILPSHVESFGTVALEAMARERLVLVSPHCGIAHWQSLQKGLICMDEKEELYAAISRLSQLSDDQRKEYAQTARASAVELNDWSLDRWHELFAKVMKERQA